MVKCWEEVEIQYAVGYMQLIDFKPEVILSLKVAVKFLKFTFSCTDLFIHLFYI